MKIGSLFTGYGGLDMAVSKQYSATLAWVADNDPTAAAILNHHHPNIPNLGDMAIVNWSNVEPVDILTGGFPCQDLSHAGRRAGLKPGTRSGLWQHMAYAVEQLRPQYVVAENVRGLLSSEAHSTVEPCPWCLGNRSDGHVRALGAILGDLADIGYDTQWCGLPASSVGAPHRRFRIFILATDTERQQQREPAIGRVRPKPGHGNTTTADTRQLPGDTGRFAATQQTTGRQPFGEPARRDRASVTLMPTPRVSMGNGPSQYELDNNDPNHRIETAVELLPTPRSSDGSKGGPNQRGSSGDLMLPSAVTQQFGQYAEAVTQWEHTLDRLAPNPTVNGRLAPAFVEWLMGLPDGHVTGVPGLSRSQQLKALGNGVVPQQAKAALKHIQVGEANE